AYADEAIGRPEVSPMGGRITIHLRPEYETSEALGAERTAALKDKVQRVVTTMVKGAFKPKVQVLEDYMDRPVLYTADPTAELLARREINQEANGVYALGPLVTRLVDYFEGHFLALAASFGAAPYRFPTLIPAEYLER